jgi:outer membrane protein assembly factor BamB
MKQRLLFMLIVFVGVPVAACGAGPGGFPCLAHDAQHTGVADGAGPPLLGAPRFVAAVPGMDMVGPATPVVAGSKIFVYAEFYDEVEQTYTDTVVLAFDELDGALLWSRPVAARDFDSISSPTAFFGEVEGQPVESVLVGSGDKLLRLDADMGAVQWTATLKAPVVNASPVVGDGVGGDGAVFISDYSGFGSGGRVYAYALADGALLWSRVIGRTSGNTPAYANGTLFVATADGAVFALDAADGAQLWKKPLLSLWQKAFYGGLSVRDGVLYVASYGFYGGQDNSTLFKLDAADGAVIWSAAAERTASIPVVAGGKVFLSGGIQGYGSVKKLECFDAASGALLWSFHDVGGWLHQPCWADGLLYASLAESSTAAFGPGGDLHVLDVSKQPGQPGFVLDVFGDAGGSPSVANGNVYAIGLLGDETALYAFGPAPQVAPRITGLVHERPTPGQEQFTITWTTRYGVTYVVQYSDGTALGAYDPAANWTDIPQSQVTESDGSPGDEGTESWTDDGTSSAGVSTTGSRFYRVRTVP